ncbi:MAG: hypothetical protein WKF73_16695 [Nocardioidaceae bacterium]
MLRASQVFQVVQAEIQQAGILRQTTHDQLPCCLRQQDLTTVRDGRNPSSAVNVHADIAFVVVQRLAGMQPDPQPDLNTVYPALTLDASLRIQSRANGVRRGPEGHEEAVALGAHLVSAVALPDVPQQCALPGQQASVVVAQL